MKLNSMMDKKLAAMREIVETLESKFGKENVVKTVPLKPEWKKLWAKLEEASTEAEKAEEKRKSLKKLFWSTVENDLEDYREMRMNTETNEVEILAE